MNEQQDYELEIDIIEWLREIKNHIAVIIAATLFFGIAAGVYVFKIKEPVYSYSKFLNCPGVSEATKLTYVNLFKNDIGVQKQDANAKAALAMVELVKSGSESKDIKEKYTSLIRFQFEGNNPDYVKEYANQYVTQSMKVLNDYIEEQYEINFSKEYLDTVRKEITRINDVIINGSMYNEGALPEKSAVNYLARLKERLETKEINKSFSKAVITDSQNNNARIVVNKSLIWKSAALGFFLSFAFVSCKYFAKVVNRK